jgi:hypothetical protein
MLVSQVITWTATLILTCALGRYLGDAGFGDLYLAMSFAVIFGGVVAFGLDQQLVRAVARDRSLASSYLVNSLALKFALSVLAYAMIIGITYLLDYSPQVKLTIAVYCLLLVFNAITESSTAVFQSYENLLHPALGTIIEKVFVAVVAILLLTRGYGVVAMAAVFVAGSALGALWRTVFLRAANGPLASRARPREAAPANGRRAPLLRLLDTECRLFPDRYRPALHHVHRQCSGLVWRRLQALRYARLSAEHHLLGNHVSDPLAAGRAVSCQSPLCAGQGAGCHADAGRTHLHRAVHAG